jgi:hypothetical protein
MSDETLRSQEQGSGVTTAGRDEGRRSALPWRRAACAGVALALAWPASAQTADEELLGTCNGATECLTTALTGLVSGFTGAAGSDLWGWMLGGSQSAGIGQISSQLSTIETTLGTIEKELGPDGPIVQQLKNLQCAADSDWIAAGPATDIGSWYESYQDFLTDLQNGTTIPLGEISSTNTDLTTLYGWANGVIQGNVNVAPNDVFAAMISLNNLAVTNSSPGTIADCIEKNGNQPKKDTLDDRPYYTNNVATIQNYLLNLNAQAMIALSEAYHIYAYGECLSNNRPKDCESSEADDVIPNLCPATNTSENCQQPITIYGRLGSKPERSVPSVHLCPIRDGWGADQQRQLPAGERPRSASGAIHRDLQRGCGRGLPGPEHDSLWTGGGRGRLDPAVGRGRSVRLRQRLGKGHLGSQPVLAV